MSEDYYINEQGLMVFTRAYHLKRGSCCGNGCLHCPYLPKHHMGSTTVSPEPKESDSKTKKPE